MNRVHECSDEQIPNKKELTDRVITLLREEGCRGDERIGQLLLKEPAIGQAMKLLSLLIDRSNTIPADLMEDEDEDDKDWIDGSSSSSGFEQGKPNHNNSNNKTAIKRTSTTAHSKHKDLINSPNVTNHDTSVRESVQNVQENGSPIATAPEGSFINPSSILLSMFLVIFTYRFHFHFGFHFGSTSSCKAESGYH